MCVTICEYYGVFYKGLAPLGFGICRQALNRSLPGIQENHVIDSITLMETLKGRLRMWLTDRQHLSSMLKAPGSLPSTTRWERGSLIKCEILQDRITLFSVCIPGCKGYRLASRTKAMVQIVMG